MELGSYEENFGSFESKYLFKSLPPPPFPLGSSVNSDVFINPVIPEDISILSTTASHSFSSASTTGYEIIPILSSLLDSHPSSSILLSNSVLSLESTSGACVSSSQQQSLLPSPPPMETTSQQSVTTTGSAIVSSSSTLALGVSSENSSQLNQQQPLNRSDPYDCMRKMPTMSSQQLTSCRSDGLMMGLMREDGDGLQPQAPKVSLSSPASMVMNPAAHLPDETRWQRRSCSNESQPSSVEGILKDVKDILNLHASVNQLRRKDSRGKWRSCSSLDDIRSGVVEEDNESSESCVENDGFAECRGSEEEGIQRRGTRRDRTTQKGEILVERVMDDDGRSSGGNTFTELAESEYGTVTDRYQSCFEEKRITLFKKYGVVVGLTILTTVVMLALLYFLLMLGFLPVTPRDSYGT